MGKRQVRLAETTLRRMLFGSEGSEEVGRVVASVMTPHAVAVEYGLYHLRITEPLLGHEVCLGPYRIDRTHDGDRAKRSCQRSGIVALVTPHATLLLSGL